MVLGSGRHQDLYYLMAQNPDIHNVGAMFFDFTREVEERVPYSVLESVKNRRIISTKYEPISLRLPMMHVVVFANFAPDRTKLSADRWDVIEIRNLVRNHLE